MVDWLCFVAVGGNILTDSSHIRLRFNKSLINPQASVEERSVVDGKYDHLRHAKHCAKLLRFSGKIARNKQKSTLRL